MTFDRSKAVQIDSLGTFHFILDTIMICFYENYFLKGLRSIDISDIHVISYQNILKK